MAGARVLSQCGPRIERLCWVFPSASGSGYALSIGFYRDRCDRSSALGARCVAGGPQRGIELHLGETTPASWQHYNSSSILRKYVFVKANRNRKKRWCVPLIILHEHLDFRLRTYLLMDETLGTVSLSHTASANSRSRISHANIVGFCRLYSAILSTTFGVATFGLEPPMTPGLILPVS